MTISVVGLEKLGGGRKLQFLRHTAENFLLRIMGAWYFNFVSKFPQNGDFQPQMLYFWKKIF